MLINPWLGQLGAGRRRRGLLLSQGLVWLSLALLWVGARSWPGLVAASFFLRGGYGAGRTLAGVRAANTVPAASRGLAFGLVETTVAALQRVAPYLAGWLYVWRPDLPILVGLMSVPVTMGLIVVKNNIW